MLRGGRTDDVRDAIQVDAARLLNVSAYTPGDYRQFYDDPRTRADYLEWAPLLLAAEDWHAAGGAAAATDDEEDA